MELVLEMEETVLVPAWLAKRAHIAKHVERPNGDVSRLSQVNHRLEMQGPDLSNNVKASSQNGITVSQT